MKKPSCNCTAYCSQCMPGPTVTVCQCTNPWAHDQCHDAPGCKIKQKLTQTPADPLDMPLPCDITVGHGTHKKGTKLRLLVARMGLLYEDAQRYYQLAATTTGPNDAQHIVSAQGESHAAIRYAEGFGKGHDAGWAAAMAHMTAHQSLSTPSALTDEQIDTLAMQWADAPASVRQLGDGRTAEFWSFSLERLRHFVRAALAA